MIDLRLMTLADLCRLEAQESAKLANIRRAIVARRGSPLPTQLATPEQSARLLGIMPTPHPRSFYGVESP